MSKQNDNAGLIIVCGLLAMLWYSFTQTSDIERPSGLAAAVAAALDEDGVDQEERENLADSFDAVSTLVRAGIIQSGRDVTETVSQLLEGLNCEQDIDGKFVDVVANSMESAGLDEDVDLSKDIHREQMIEYLNGVSSGCLK